MNPHQKTTKNRLRMKFLILLLNTFYNFSLIYFWSCDESTLQDLNNFIHYKIKFYEIIIFNIKLQHGIPTFMRKYFLTLMAFQTGLPEIDCILDMAAIYEMSTETENPEVSNELIVLKPVYFYVTNIDSQLKWCTLNQSVNKALIHEVN